MLLILVIFMTTVFKCIYGKSVKVSLLTGNEEVELAKKNY